MYFVHYFSGPSDDDIRLVDVVESFAVAQKIAVACPDDETAQICDEFGYGYDLESGKVIAG